jgi:hypothetical protein
VALAADNTDVTEYNKANPFIVAFQIDEEKGPWTAQYDLRWRNVTDGGSFAVAGNTGEIRWASTGTVSLNNGNAVTIGEKACSATGGSGSTWQDGEEAIGTYQTNSINLADECYTECHIGANPANALAGKQYEFQLYDSTNSAAIGTAAAKITIAGSVTYTKTASLDAALNKAGQTKTPGLNAYLKSIFTKVPSVDGYLKKGFTQTFSADGLLNATGLTQSSDLDSLLSKLGLARDASLDAILYAAAVTYTETAALDSYLQAGYTRAAGIDALIQLLAQEKPLSADALLQLLATKTASVDALLFAAILKNVGVDGVLNKVGLDRTASADALLNKIGLTRTASLDAILTQTVTQYLAASLDGYLQKGETRTASADALLNKAAQVKSFGADGYLQAGMTRAGSLDACILGTLLKTISIDAALNKVGLTGASSVDAFLKKLGASSASLDAALLAFATNTLGVDAILFAPAGEQQLYVSIDALLNRVGLTGSSSLDALLQKLSLTRAASIDAFLQAAYTRTLGIDGIVSKAYYETPSLDALAQKTQEEPSALDALLNRTGAMLTVSADAFLSAALSGAASLDGYLYREVIATAVADALLQAGYSGAASLDAILQGLGQMEIIALFDALLHATGLERPASFDAFLYRRLSRTPALDACLERIGGATGQRESVRLGGQETHGLSLSHSKPTIHLRNPRRTQ